MLEEDGVDHVPDEEDDDVNDEVLRRGREGSYCCCHHCLSRLTPRIATNNARCLQQHAMPATTVDAING